MTALLCVHMSQLPDSGSLICSFHLNFNSVMYHQMRAISEKVSFCPLKVQPVGWRTSNLDFLNWFLGLLRLIFFMSHEECNCIIFISDKVILRFQELFKREKNSK